MSSTVSEYVGGSISTVDCSDDPEWKRKVTVFIRSILTSTLRPLCHSLNDEEGNCSQQREHLQSH